MVAFGIQDYRKNHIRHFDLSVGKNDTYYGNLRLQGTTFLVSNRYAFLREKEWLLTLL